MCACALKKIFASFLIVSAKIWRLLRCSERFQTTVLWKAALSKQAVNRCISPATQKNAPVTIISYACSSIISNEAARHWKNLNWTVGIKTNLKGRNKMDEIWVCQDWEYRGFFTSDPILKITVIFNIYLRDTSSHKFMHVEKKANQDFARFY